MFSLLRSYWKTYGGCRALVVSPFFHFAVLITTISWEAWLYGPWWVYTLEIIPSLLGFTLGGYAILLAFGDQRFIDLIRGPNGAEPSPYMDLNCAFLHFLLLQISALWFAIVAKFSSISFDTVYDLVASDGGWGFELLSFAFDAFSFLGFLALVYSICAALPAVLAVFVVAETYDAVDFSEQNKPKDEKPDK